MPTQYLPPPEVWNLAGGIAIALTAIFALGFASASDPLWRRFIARFIDIIWIMAVFIILLVTAIATLGIKDEDLVFGLFIVIIALIPAVEGLTYSAAGNTPGKALVGIKVGDLDDKPLSLVAYTWRSYKAFLIGAGAATPYLWAITGIIQYWCVKRSGTALYDRNNVSIAVSDLSTARKIIVTVTIILGLTVGLTSDVHGTITLIRTGKFA